MSDLTPIEFAAAEAIEATSPMPLTDRQRNRMARAAIRAARSLIGAEAVAVARPLIAAEALRKAAEAIADAPHPVYATWADIAGLLRSRADRIDGGSDG